MATIRIKWTVRREDNGDYYVDETIGENSASIVSGPMAGDAAIRFVDERESEARRQFEQLKSEMTGRSAAAIWSGKTAAKCSRCGAVAASRFDAVLKQA